MSPTLLQYRWDEHSQNGEDGVIEELFDRLDINGGWFCEFGAWDGKHLSNTYNLVSGSGEWNGILIEGDPEKYEDLKETVSEHPERLIGINSYVTSTGDTALDNLLDDTDIPRNFELLSVDIDGPDYFVWKNTTEYRPKVVVIEINPEIGSELRFITEMSPNGRFQIDPESTNHPPNFSRERKGEQIRLFGTSFRSMVELGQSKGYTPVSCTEHNVFFVLDEYVDEIGLTSEEHNDPSTLFLDKWGHANEPEPFYQMSISENYRMIQSSVQENGLIETGKLGVSKVVNDVIQK